MKALFASRGISKFFVTVDNNPVCQVGSLTIKTVLRSANLITDEASIEVASPSLQMIDSTALYSSLPFFGVSALIIIVVKILVFRERLTEVAILKALGPSSEKEK